MKFNTLLLVIIMSITLIYNVYAQGEKLDKIIMKDKTAIDGIVLRVTEKTIEFDPIGETPFILITRSEVDAIIYSDNTVVKFETTSGIVNEASKKKRYICQTFM